jgi:multimeric flavodoxin WrbA
MRSLFQKLFLIIWWSRTGASAALAQACFDSANEAAGPNLEVLMVRADRVELADLLRANGVVFVCPENLGSMAGMMKEFFDLHYYQALGRLEGIPYQAMVSAGSDGGGAVRQIDRIVTGWRLRRIADAVIVNVQAQDSVAILAPKHLSTAQLDCARDIGLMFASGLEMGVL